MLTIRQARPLLTMCFLSIPPGRFEIPPHLQSKQHEIYHFSHFQALDWVSRVKFLHVGVDLFTRSFAYHPSVHPSRVYMLQWCSNTQGQTTGQLALCGLPSALWLWGSNTGPGMSAGFPVSHLASQRVRDLWAVYKPWTFLSCRMKLIRHLIPFLTAFLVICLSSFNMSFRFI